MTLKGLKYYLRNPQRIYAAFSTRGLLNWMSDRAYLELAYKMTTGKRLDLKHPKTFNEKLQWLKLYDRKPLYTQLVDKYAVRGYIAEKLGEEYLIPLVGGPWESVDEIDLEMLPEQFVLKCNHDSGGLVICRDKRTMDFESAEQKLHKALKRNYFRVSREWPYKNIHPRIIAEQYMVNDIIAGARSCSSLIDYKFFTFDGEPRLLYVSQGLEHHPTAYISFFDLDGCRLPFKRTDFRGFEDDPPMPKNMPKMIDISRQLAREIGSPFLRVDLYEIQGTVYFSEFTFFPCSGMIPLDPAEWDRELGEWLVLPQVKE